jgi:hypothetical protein
LPSFKAVESRRARVTGCPRVLSRKVFTTTSPGLRREIREAAGIAGPSAS